MNIHVLRTCNSVSESLAAAQSAGFRHLQPALPHHSVSRLCCLLSEHHTLWLVGTPRRKSSLSIDGRSSWMRLMVWIISIAHAAGIACLMRPPTSSHAARHSAGRTRLPPASSEYLSLQQVTLHVSSGGLIALGQQSLLTSSQATRHSAGPACRPPAANTCHAKDTSKVWVRFIDCTVDALAQAAMPNLDGPSPAAPQVRFMMAQTSAGPREDTVHVKTVAWLSWRYHGTCWL